MSAARKIESIPWVETDDGKVAELAALHLIERGFRNFAFCGAGAFNWSVWRGEAFVKILKEHRFDCHVFSPKSSRASVKSWPQEKPSLAAWLKALPKPIGLFASYDIRAGQVLDICRDLDILVPDEVAVVGVDNDPIICNLAHPSLTSVIPDSAGPGIDRLNCLID